jgi:hypothetical protein
LGYHSHPMIAWVVSTESASSVRDGSTCLFVAADWSTGRRSELLRTSRIPSSCPCVLVAAPGRHDSTCSPPNGCACTCAPCSQEPSTLSALPILLPSHNPYNTVAFESRHWSPQSRFWCVAFSRISRRRSLMATLRISASSPMNTGGNWPFAQSPLRSLIQ